MIAATVQWIPGWVIAAAGSALIAATVGLGIALAATRERVARLEARLNGGDRRHAGAATGQAPTDAP